MRISKGKVYIITNDTNDDIYIGSTLKSLKKRMIEHYCNARIGNKHTSMSEYIKKFPLLNFKIQLLAEYEVWCDNQKSKQLIAYEQLWLNKFKNKHIINKFQAFDLFQRKCLHNKYRSICKECKGNGICKHNKVKYSCKECKGTGICEHNKYRSICKECKGNGICEHNKIRSYCKQCKGGAICLHNKQRTRCKECRGGSICKHNKQRHNCKDCKGNGICEHNRQKKRCKECKGTGICEHNNRRERCKECNPVECKLCGITTSKANYPRHTKSKKHIQNQLSKLKI